MNSPQFAPTGTGIFSSADLADYARDGYIFARSLFTAEEIALLRDTARQDHAMDKASSSRDDGPGTPSGSRSGTIRAMGSTGCSPEVIGSSIPWNSSWVKRYIITIPR